MISKAIVLFAFLAIAFTERPHLGFRMRFPSPIAPHIIGGSEAPKALYPQIVSLQWGFTQSSTSHFCAGSIYAKKWVITAAHCALAVPNYGTLLIKAGTNNIKDIEESEQVVKAEKMFVHDQYGGGVGPFDIALIKLETALNFTKEVQPIALPISDSEPIGKAILCGWGLVSKNGLLELPDKLQHINLVYVDRETCHKSVERLTGYSPVHETNICTGPLTGGISACNGDSGGPLISISDEEAVLVGIVSWGIVPCGTVGAPSVYTRVSKFNKWIETIAADK